MYDLTPPPYSDTCPTCYVPVGRVVVAPKLVHRASNGSGVNCDYTCPRGHSWSAAWAWWDDRPHATDDAA